MLGICHVANLGTKGTLGTQNILLLEKFTDTKKFMPGICHVTWEPKELWELRTYYCY